MIRIFFYLLLVLFSLKGFSQEAAMQISSIMEEQEKSWNAGDIPSFMNAYWKSDSLIFVGKSGANYGWNKTLNNYIKSYPNKDVMGQLEFGIIKLDMISDQAAFMLGTWKLTRKDDSLKGHFSLLWRKINGEWKIVADHSSSS